MIEIVKSDVKKISLEHLVNHIDEHEKKQLLCEAGQEWYKLLAYLSKTFINKVIIDIGTRRGCSAVALSYNSRNEVVSYDVENWHPQCTQPNVKFKLENLLETDMEICDNSPLIVIDVDPHDGDKERIFLDKLRKRDYNGIVVLDDIGQDWPRLHEFWNSIPETKYDLTDVGHASGTGIVDFGRIVKIV